MTGMVVGKRRGDFWGLRFCGRDSKGMGGREGRELGFGECFVWFVGI